MDKVEELCRRAGGTNIDVPSWDHALKQPAAFNRLAKLIGIEVALPLVHNFGGSRVYVPRGPGPVTVDAKVVARLTRKGWSASRIARKLGCSDRTVFAKRAAMRAQSKEKTP